LRRIVGRETIIPCEDIPGMWCGAKPCSRSCSATPPATPAFFGVPTGQVVEFGTEIEIQSAPDAAQRAALAQQREERCGASGTRKRQD
jgi:hypothetical protein